MHSVSITFNDIAAWCDKNCPGHWYWGWMTMRKDLASFYTHVCFDRSEDALMFRLSFPL